IGTPDALETFLFTARGRHPPPSHNLEPSETHKTRAPTAERLGIPVSAVTVESGDTTLPPSPVTGGSNQTASCCSVVLKACGAIRRKLYGSSSETVGGPVRWCDRRGSGDVPARLCATSCSGALRGRPMYRLRGRSLRARGRAE